MENIPFSTDEEKKRAFCVAMVLEAVEATDPKSITNLGSDAIRIAEQLLGYIEDGALAK